MKSFGYRHFKKHKASTYEYELKFYKKESDVAFNKNVFLEEIKKTKAFSSQQKEMLAEAIQKACEPLKIELGGLYKSGIGIRLLCQNKAGHWFLIGLKSFDPNHIYSGEPGKTVNKDHYTKEEIRAYMIDRNYSYVGNVATHFELGVGF